MPFHIDHSTLPLIGLNSLCLVGSNWARDQSPSVQFFFGGMTPQRVRSHPAELKKIVQLLYDPVFRQENVFRITRWADRHPLL